MQVLVDTGALFAAFSPTDDHHGRAAAILTRARAEGWSLVVTNAVLVEVHALFVCRLRNGPAMGLQLFDAVQRGGAFRKERVSVQDEESAIELLRAHRDKRYSLCDALSFVVAQRLRITHAVSYDKHFAQWGRLILL